MAAPNATKSAPVVEDFLDEDQEIPGQKFVLLSFLSPENVLAKKDHFFFEKFLQAFEVDWKVKNIEKFLASSVLDINKQLTDRIEELEKAGQMETAEICRKNLLKVEPVLETYQEFVRKNQKEFNRTKIVEAWDDFMFNNRSKLEEEFHSANDFQTTIRGLKVRGVAGSQKEAEVRAKKIQQKDKYHNILLGEVGKWLPWDPAPTQVADQHYAEDQLNTLMQKYRENEDAKEKFFEERKKGGEGKKLLSGGAAAGGAGTESLGDAVGGMFGATGDLALQRKMEQKKTIEVVSGDQEDGGVSESKSDSK
jgi:hypothetical protein